MEKNNYYNEKYGDFICSLSDAKFPGFVMDEKEAEEGMKELNEEIETLSGEVINNSDIIYDGDGHVFYKSDIIGERFPMPTTIPTVEDVAEAMKLIDDAVKEYHNKYRNKKLEERI